MGWEGPALRACILVAALGLLLLGGALLALFSQGLRQLILTMLSIG